MQISFDLDATTHPFVIRIVEESETFNVEDMVALHSVIGHLIDAYRESLTEESGG